MNTNFFIAFADKNNRKSWFKGCSDFPRYVQLVKYYQEIDLLSQKLKALYFARSFLDTCSELLNFFTAIILFNMYMKKNGLFICHHRCVVN